jgi:hypothetical protein
MITAAQKAGLSLARNEDCAGLPLHYLFDAIPLVGPD